MRHYTIWLVATFAFALASCQLITQPIPDSTAAVLDSTSSQDSPSFSTSTGTIGFTSTPDEIVAASFDDPTVVEFDAGLSHSLAVSADGSVWAWGRSFEGQLGLVPDEEKRFETTPIMLTNLPKPIIDVEAGGDFSLALADDGSVWVWGLNEDCQLGIGSADTDQIVPPTQITGLPVEVTAISAGTSHALALDSSGRLWAWGDNTSGKLGDGTSEDRCTPVQVQTDEIIVEIAVNPVYNIALTDHGTVLSWGCNNWGQLGIGQFSDQDCIGDDPAMHPTPVQIQNLAGIVKIAAGNAALAMDSDDILWRWGQTEFDPTVTEGIDETDASTPSQLFGPTNMTKMDSWTEVLLLEQNGTVWQWGFIGNDGLNGYGPSNPEIVPELVNIADISAGTLYALALDYDGNLWAWGLNRSGQLGDGTIEDRETPVQVLPFVDSSR